MSNWRGSNCSVLKYLKEIWGSIFNAQNPLATFTHSSSGILAVTFYKVLEEAIHTGRHIKNNGKWVDLCWFGEAGHLSDVLKLDSLFNFTGVIAWGSCIKNLITWPLISLSLTCTPVLVRIPWRSSFHIDWVRTRQFGIEESCLFSLGPIPWSFACCSTLVNVLNYD